MSHKLKFAVEGVALTSVAIFGIIGTLMALVILLKPRARSSARDYFSVFLTALAVFDTMLLFNAMLIIGIPRIWVR